MLVLLDDHSSLYSAAYYFSQGLRLEGESVRVCQCVCCAVGVQKAREEDLADGETALMKQFGDAEAVKAVDYSNRSELLLLIICTDSQSGKMPCKWCLYNV